MRKAVVMASLALVGILSSCGGKGNNASTGSGVENKTIQLKLYKGGYEEEWLTEMIRQFESTFQEEGYHVEVTEHSNNLTGALVQEELLLGGSKNATDLYFVQGTPIPTVIAKSQKITHDANKVVLESLDDILAAPAIGADKKAETDTIQSRFRSGFLERTAYDGKLTAFQGQHFSLPWATGACTLAVNMDKLTSLGLTIPYTSDEFVASIKTIAEKRTTTGIYPYAWGGYNASAYWAYLFETFFAQYVGQKKAMDFVDVVPSSGTTKDNGYDVYKDDGFKLSLEEMKKFLNLDYAPDGSSGMKHIEAQHKFVTGEAVFMANGDWLMEEMNSEYHNEVSKVQLIKVPVISALGSKLGLTDAELSKTVQAIDEGKTDAAILALVGASLTSESLESVRAARSIYLNLGVNHQILIPSYADAKIGAKKFVQFLYSQDGCSIFKNKAHAYLPLSYTPRADDESCDYLTALDKLYNNTTSTTVSEVGTFRTLSSMVLFNSQAWRYPETFATMMTKSLAPDDIYDGEYTYLKNNWSTYSVNA